MWAVLLVVWRFRSPPVRRRGLKRIGNVGSQIDLGRVLVCPALGRRKQVAGLSEATFGGVLDAGADEPLVGLQGPVRAYAKPEREDLTPADTKALTRLVAAIKKERQGSDDGTHRPSDVRLKRALGEVLAHVRGETGLYSYRKPGASANAAIAALRTRSRGGGPAGQPATGR